MTDDAQWPEDYVASVKLFRHAAKTAGAQLQSHTISACGPNGEALSIDVAALISTQDEHRIVITSGVHGVEGYLGAAVQLHLLHKLNHTLKPEKTGIVMIHAVNPWGYAYNRRVNENNIDLNRNFINTASKIADNAQYAELDATINPKEQPTLTGEVAHWLAAFRMIMAKRGIKPLFGPIAQGQYEYPKALFYGGDKLSESCAVLQHLVQTFTADTPRVSVLDIHSGLGKSAQAMLIGHCNYLPDGDSGSSLEHILEQNIIKDNDSSNAYNAQGTFARWCHASLNNKQLIYLCIELGTYNPLTVFTALRRENQAYHWNNGAGATLPKTTQTLRRVFTPESSGWKSQSLRATLDVIERIMSLPSRIG